MEQSFIIKRKGFAATDPNVYVLKGYFVDNFHDGCTFRAFYGTEELTAELRIREGAAVYRRCQSLDDGRRYVDREYFLYVKLPQKRNPVNHLRIFECRGRERALLCQVNERTLQREKKSLECSIDSVRFFSAQECEQQDLKQTADGRLGLLSGWAVSERPFFVEIRNRAGELQKSVTETFLRRDVIEEYAEIFQNVPDTAAGVQCGFRTVFEVPEDRAYIRITDGERSQKREIVLNADGMALRPPRFLEHLQEMHGKLGTLGVMRHYLHMEKPLPSEWELFPVEPPSYEEWRAKEKQVCGTGQSAAKDMGGKPLFSIVVPLYHTKQEHLQELMESIRKQAYINWELCLSDGGGTESQLEGCIQEFCRSDRRIRAVKSRNPLGISENTNAALALAKGDYVVFCDHDDLLHPDALAECAKRIQAHSDIDLIYTDEDKVSMDGTEHFQPHFKPDFNKELLRSMNYFCHLVVVKRSLLEQTGGLDTAFDGAQDYDLVLRCAELAKHICHIPKVLYHWRAHRDSTAENPQSKRYAFEAGARALNAHYQRCGIPARAEEAHVPGMYRILWQKQGELPLLSVILSGNDAQETAFDAETLKAAYPKLEVIPVNGETAADLNAAAQNANGELLLFLDRRMRAVNPDGLIKMAGFCLQKDAAAVGARVEYTYNGSIRQCGVIFEKDGRLYRAFEGTAKEEDGYFARIRSAMDVSILLKECMMVRHSVFTALGGFDARLIKGYYDADFCLRAKEKGLRSIYCPEAAFRLPLILQSADTEKDRLRFVKKWKKTLEAGDPNYNPNLSARRADYSLRLQ